MIRLELKLMNHVGCQSVAAGFLISGAPKNSLSQFQFYFALERC